MVAPSDLERGQLVCELDPPQNVHPCFFLTAFGLSPLDTLGSSHVPCIRSSFGVGSMVLKIDDVKAAAVVTDITSGLESVILADKLTGSTLSRSIRFDVSGCKNSLKLG